MPTIDVTIEKLIYGGEGLAHHDGATVFVPFVLPDERISASPVKQKKKFVRAQVQDVLTPSQDRVAPRCPHFGVCGGCDYQHIGYDSQLKYKTEILRETLRRIGRIEWTGEIVAHASPPWAYRNRAQWKIRPAADVQESSPTPTAAEERDAAAGAHLGIGYFRANSTALCAVEDCPIVSPLLLKTLLALRESLTAGALPKNLREIEAFAGADDSQLLLTATFSGFPARAEELEQKIREIAPEIGSLLFHDPTRERMQLFGPGFIPCGAAGCTYRVGHFSFFQVNRFLAGDLASEVVEKDPGGSLALDLFAGVGLFSVPLAERFDHVVAVEANPASARDLEANIATIPRAANGRGVAASVEVRVAEVEQFLAKFRGKPQLVVLDPPRAGLTPPVVKYLARIAPERITYVSCDPPTLARDLAAFQQAGYELGELHLFDLFPQTFHMETVARLRRRP
ncbi:MAG TPA: 23S rRNA (uracil(1939)-C(5))-methyltransferase RlmD [Candidatus Dormibacteraeota bacterium]|nr:23S rRNA (uracil(1939)-C(5))-methyltransferase RlmD [Candidatus Dormibacteraeota bacterium]